jgi:hypothetical protein
VIDNARNEVRNEKGCGAARLVNELPQEKEWLYEVKFDGDEESQSLDGLTLRSRILRRDTVGTPFFGSSITK